MSGLQVTTMHKVYLEKLIIQQENLPYFSRELIEKQQLDLINLQLKRARTVSSFYAEYPEKLDTLSDLAKLPFMTSEMLTENYPKLCLSTSEELSRVRTEYTSGTVGTPKKVAYSDYDSNRTIDFFENGLAELIFPGDTVIICFPILR